MENAKNLQLLTWYLVEENRGTLPASLSLELYNEITKQCTKKQIREKLFLSYKSKKNKI